MADREGFSKFFGVNIIYIPTDTESIDDPKQTLINIIKKSRIKSMRDDILPKNNSARIGPDYNGRLIEFINNIWDINRAVLNNESLRRSVNKLKVFEFSMP